MSDDPQIEARLESWKSIAGYLNRDVRTVRRWEASEGLPVHRHHHLARSTVYAFPSELDAWRAGRRPDAAEPEAPSFSRSMRVAAVAAVALLTLTAAGHGAIRLNAQATQGQTLRAIWTGDGVDPMGSPSSDGRYLSFTDWNTGNLALRDLVEGKSRPLTNTGGWEKSGDFAEFSSLSPDGRQIAYAWFVDRGDDLAAKACRCRYELRVMNVTGPDAGKPRILMAGSDTAFWVRPAAWTPDGKSIVVARSVKQGANELGLVSLADGSFRLIRSAGARPADHLSLSPDGRLVAMDVAERADGLSSDIVLIDVATGNQAPLVTNPANDHSPVFTPDGSSVLFISDRTNSGAVWRVPIQGDKAMGPPVMVTTIPNGSGMLGALRNGALYYFSGGNASNIFIADIDSAANRRSEPVMAVERFINANNLPVFSPDGQRLAYYSRRGAAMGSSKAALMIHTLATKQDREVPLTIDPVDGLSWFPDGRSALVTTREVDGSRFVFHRVDIATGASQVVFSSSETRAGFGTVARRPLVTPDGRALVYGDYPPGVEQKGPGAMVLRRMDLQSARATDIVRTASADEWITSFAISPDGRAVAYLRSDGPNRVTVLEIVSLVDTSPPREVYRDRSMGGSRFNGLAWTRDNRYVLFTRANEDGSRGASLWKVPSAGGPAESTGLATSGQLRFPSIAPDGSRIAFAVGNQIEPAIWSLENFLPRK